MTSNISVLQNFRPRDFSMQPFPHVFLENALPQDLYDELAATYPESILAGQTSGFKDFRYCQADFTDVYINSLWWEFINFHTSREFKDQVIRALEPGLQQFYPDLVQKYSEVPVILRHQGKPHGAAAMELQFVMNSADTEKIRTPHLDQGRELFACLFYMKRPSDTSVGGDLWLYEKNTPDFTFQPGRLAPLDLIRPAKHVPYAANNLVIFLNTIDSIHGVSPREQAHELRRYVNIDCHIREKLFVLDKAHVS